MIQDVSAVTQYLEVIPRIDPR